MREDIETGTRQSTEADKVEVAVESEPRACRGWPGTARERSAADPLTTTSAARTRRRLHHLHSPYPHPNALSIVWPSQPLEVVAEGARQSRVEGAPPAADPGEGRLGRQETGTPSTREDARPVQSTTSPRDSQMSTVSHIVCRSRTRADSGTLGGLRGVDVR